MRLSPLSIPPTLHTCALVCTNTHTSPLSDGMDPIPINPVPSQRLCCRPRKTAELIKSSLDEPELVLIEESSHRNRHHTFSSMVLPKVDFPLGSPWLPLALELSATVVTKSRDPSMYLGRHVPASLNPVCERLPHACMFICFLLRRFKSPQTQQHKTTPVY